MLSSAISDKSSISGIFQSAKPVVSAHLFFNLYPSLYVVLLHELKMAVKDSNKSEVSSILYPVLSVLSRLKVDPANDFIFPLSAYSELVMECSYSKHWKLREISADTLPNLIHHSNSNNLLFSILGKLNKSTNLNYRHGSALQVSALIKSLPSGSINKEMLARSFLNIEWLINLENHTVAGVVLLEVICDLFMKSHSGKGCAEMELCRLVAEKCLSLCSNLTRASEPIPSRFFPIFAYIIRNSHVPEEIFELSMKSKVMFPHLLTELSYNMNNVR
jgi:hypothetical protein